MLVGISTTLTGRGGWVKGHVLRLGHGEDNSDGTQMPFTAKSVYWMMRSDDQGNKGVNFLT